MLEVHIQNFSYGKKEILNQIDLELPSSQIIGLVAPNGVGKSTLIQILSGHLRNNGISVCYQGKNYTTDTLFMRQHIVKMPDQSELYDELNGIEHLNFYASMWKVASGTVQTVIEQLKMEDYIHQKVGGYSLGMRQRLCFALVLVTKADYMLVDEVMNGLDPDNVELISKVLRQLRDEGKTIVIATEQSRFDCRQDLFYERETNRAGIFTAKGRRGYTSTYFYLRRAFQKLCREIFKRSRHGES